MKETIRDFIIVEFLEGQKDAELATDEDLLATGVIDSIGLMQLIAFIEEQFSLKVEPQEMTIDHFMNIDAIGDYVEKKKG